MGLLAFDTPAGYAMYAEGVLANEKGNFAPRSRRMMFFAPRHDFDASTQLSADRLVKPLVEGTLSRRVGCQFESVWGEQAKRDALTEIVMRSAVNAPGLLFTASHGMGFPLGHADQRSQQGALLCQDWAGPKAGRVARDHYFAASDVPDTANVVDRAWNHSIMQAGAGPQLIPFENAIGRMLAGMALKDFNERFATLSVSLAGMIEQIEGDGLIIPDAQLATVWIQRNDAEGYALFGDPAARLRLEKAA